MAHKGYSCDIKGCPETRSENQDRAVVRECELNGICALGTSGWLKT
jgi:hypothetical protein